MNMCECVKCTTASKFRGVDFLMWRVELGWSTVRDDDLLMGEENG